MVRASFILKGNLTNDLNTSILFTRTKETESKNSYNVGSKSKLFSPSLFFKIIYSLKI